MLRTKNRTLDNVITAIVASFLTGVFAFFSFEQNMDKILSACLGQAVILFLFLQFVLTGQKKK